jgi:hypothetical protein
MTTMQIVIDVEAQDDTTGTTIGWIVPAGTPDADLEIEAVDSVRVDATEDEVAWEQGMRAAITAAGWTIDGAITTTGHTVTATLTR